MPRRIIDLTATAKSLAPKARGINRRIVRQALKASMHQDRLAKIRGDATLPSTTVSVHRPPATNTPPIPTTAASSNAAPQLVRLQAIAKDGTRRDIPLSVLANPNQ